MKNKSFIRSIVMTAMVCGASTAFADPSGTWTSAGATGELVSYGDGTRVADNFQSATNPGSCSSTSHVEPLSSLSAAAKDEMGRILVAAHMSGRNIRLKISTTCSSNNYRTYVGVELQ
jgi:hypothetical protein